MRCKDLETTVLRLERAVISGGAARFGKLVGEADAGEWEEELSGAVMRRNKDARNDVGILKCPGVEITSTPE